MNMNALGQLLSPTSRSLIMLCAVVQLALASVTHASTFKRWRNQLSETCTFQRERTELWLEDLQSTQVLISLYPKRFSVTALDWVGRGGVLMLALNEEGVTGASALLKALDLSPLTPQEGQRGLRGAWPFPQSRLGTQQTSSPFTFPWVTWSPLAFEEGESWLKQEIAPIAIDEEGRSLAYRVRYGKGIITLFGDADALSDDLLVSPDNRRFTQSLTWWLTKKRRDQSEECSISWISVGGAFKSRAEEQSLKHRLQDWLQSLKAWWHKITETYSLSSAKVFYTLLILCFVFILNMLTSRRDWKRRFTLRRD